MEPLGGEKRETRGEGISGLRAECRNRADSRPVLPFLAVFEDKAEEVVVLFHGLFQLVF
jgi:hypothetical protein